MFKRHLGSNIYAQVQSLFNGVNIRTWLQPKEGMRFTTGQSTISPCFAMCKVDDYLGDLVPELKYTVRCSDQTDHCDHLGGIDWV